MLYGNAAKNRRYEEVEYVPGMGVVADNASLVDLLLRLDGLPGTDEANLTVSTGAETALQRLDGQIRFTAGQPFMEDYPGLSRWMGEMGTLFDAWRAAPPGDTKTHEGAITNAARRAAVPGAWPVFSSDREGGAFRAIGELLLVVANLGDDHGAVPRSIFADHEYTVRSAHFRDRSGADLGMTLTNREALLPSVDAERSSVTLQNPHNGFEPDPSGTHSGGDGVFDLSLVSFCRLFSRADFVRVSP